MAVNGYRLGVGSAPVAARELYVHPYPDRASVDYYHWLRDDSRQNATVLSYLREENAYAQRVLSPLAPLVDAIAEEFNATQSARKEYPLVEGEWTYFSSTEQGKPRYYRRRGDVVQLVKDFNEHTPFYRVDRLVPSRNNRYVAYTVDPTGNEAFQLVVVDMATRKETKVLDDICEDIVWSADSNRIFYLTRDAAWRPHRLMQFSLQENSTRALYTEDDPQFHAYLAESVSRNYLFLNLHKTTCTEVWSIDLSLPHATPTVISPRVPERVYTAEHQNEDFLILANLHQHERYINFVLLRAPISDPNVWSILRPYDPSEYIVQVYGMERYTVMEIRRDGVLHVSTLHLPEPEFGEGLFLATVDKLHLQYASDKVPIIFSSPITPRTLYELDLPTNALSMLHRDEVANYNPTLYTTQRVVTPGGVPISLVYKRHDNPAKAPLVLEAFGCYGLSVEPGFRAEIFSLLDRGFVYALVHVRGGSEKGMAWYEQGKLLQKMNSFQDLAESANHLLRINVTSHITVMAVASGGMVAAATINQHPLLFQTAVLRVPFVDVLNTMMDPSLPLTITEYEEWGNPTNLTYFDYIRKYSPYDNIPARPAKLPNILVRSGLHDPRVQFWEPAKYVAQLRHASPSGTFLLATNLHGGHFFSSDLPSALRSFAEDYAFVIASHRSTTPKKRKCRPRQHPGAQ